MFFNLLAAINGKSRKTAYSQVRQSVSHVSFQIRIEKPGA